MNKLILLSAPAGYGKTALITEWLDQSNHDRVVCWFSLDDDDSEPRHFFTYLAATTRPLSGVKSSLQQLLKLPQRPPAKNLMAAFISDVTDVFTPFYLILDDYHVIEAAEIDKAMVFLLDHMPSQMTLVITSRADPGFPISRLRVRGELTELRAGDLRFSEGEAAQFLQKNMGLNLSLDQIAALETRTEGWIAGLQMAALSMQGRTDNATFIQAFTGSHRFVLDYLAEEVLQNQPERLRNFLLQTSIFDRLSGSLCDAAIGQNGSKEILEHLERANMFVVPLDDERQWYRYHHLFADVLQARLITEQSETIPTLHRRASEWFERNDSLPDAIDHALAAEDYERAARLLELIWSAMDESFQSSTWLGWAMALPDELFHCRPVLSVDYAWAFLNDGELEAAVPYLRDAQRWLVETNETNDLAEDSSGEMVVVDVEQFHLLPASIATAHAYYHMALGDISSTVLFAQQALNLLPEKEYLRRGPAAALLGLAYWAGGELEAAYQALSEAMNGFLKSGNITFAISGTYGLADIRIAQGRLSEAINIYKRSLRLAQAQGDPAIPGTADLYLGLSKLYFERGDLQAAQKNLSKSEAMGEQAALADWPYRLRIAKARIKQAEGDLDGAIMLLSEAEELYFATPIPNTHPIDALKAQVWVRHGRMTEALAWVQECGLSVDGDLSYLREYEFITLARIRIAQYVYGHSDQANIGAMRLIERLLNAAEDGKRTGSIIELLLLQALAFQAQAEKPSALTSLERALRLAEPEGYARIFTDEGLPMKRLLLDTAVRQALPDYVAKLLSLFEERKQNNTGDSQAPPSVDQQLVDPLSKRELEILTLIAAGLKNKEIAEQLVISINTVLYHIKNIYSKLGVNKRTLAITKAKDHDLI